MANKGASTRREFLKRTAFAGVGAAAAGGILNAVSPRLWPGKPEFDPNNSLWAQAGILASPSLDENLTIDVAILGGGFTGLSSAYHIAKLAPERQVVVLEASTVGSGASGRNGGMVLTQPSNQYLQLEGDPATHKRLYQLTAENIRSLQLVMSEQGEDCDLDLPGTVLAILNESKLAEAREYLEQAQRLGLPFELWDRRRTRDELGTDFYLAAVHDPHGGQLHPLKWCHTLKKAAESIGVKVFGNTVVSSIEPGKIVTLHTASGYTVRAKSVVLATNAFTSRLGFFRNAMVPLRSYVAATARLGPDLQTALGWRSRVPYSDSKTLLHYAALGPDNRLRFGGGYVEYSFSDGLHSDDNAQPIFDDLHAEMVRRYPMLANTPFEYAWSGLIDMTIDDAPFLGITGADQNIFYGLGYCGHGVNLTFLFGRIIADLEAGNKRHWEWLPFLNRKPPYLPNEPFRWLGVKSEVEFYRRTGK